MRILLLSQFFDPEPASKGLAFARALAADGDEVEVLTGVPNYPGGKVYAGHRVALHQREVIDGITVHRVPLYPSHDRNPLRRVANYASFALSAAAIGPWVVRRPDVAFVYGQPLTISLPAVWMQLLERVPFVFQIEDIWPDALRGTGMLTNPLLLDVIGAWAKVVYGLADHIVVQSDGFRDLLCERGVPGAKVDVVRNWCEEGRMVMQPRDPQLLKQHGLEGRFNVMFAGTMGLAQALDAVLDAAKLTQQRLPTVQYVFVGGGIDKPRLERRASELGLDNVRFIPRMPLEQMGRILPLADVQLVHLRDDPQFHRTIPWKTQSSLYAGLPIIYANRGDGARLVEQANAGVVCEPQDPASIAAAVSDLAGRSPAALAAMGQSGKAYYDRELSMAIGVKRYREIIRKVAARS